MAKKNLNRWINGAGESKRRKLDFYPTPKNVTEVLADFLIENKILKKGALVWEPACGNGAMSMVLEAKGFTVGSSDIRKSGYGISGVDFTKAAGQPKLLRFDAVITNPPFIYSEEFIRVGSECKVLCLLLKSQYWHAKTRAKLFQSTPPAYILPLTWRPDFYEHERKKGEKGHPSMEVTWNVWIRGSKKTIYQPLVK